MDQIQWALKVETEELGITAGLQDRVIQTMGGCVLMQFEQSMVEKTGNGIYTPIDPSLLPPMFIAYCSKPKDISFCLLSFVFWCVFCIIMNPRRISLILLGFPLLLTRECSIQMSRRGGWKEIKPSKRKWTYILS